MGNKQVRGGTRNNRPPMLLDDDLEIISDSPTKNRLTIFDCQALSAINCCAKEDEESKEFRTELTIADHRENVEGDDNTSQKPNKGN